MPCSSNHDSKGEEQLILLYQLIFLRFYYCDLKQRAYGTTAYFQELLDWPSDETAYSLVDTLKDEPEWTENWKKFICNTKSSVNMYAAAEYMCDAAHVLRTYGRVKEADTFLPWVEETQAMAREFEYQETNWGGYDYHHHGG